MIISITRNFTDAAAAGKTKQVNSLKQLAQNIYMVLNPIS